MRTVPVLVPGKPPALSRPIAYTSASIGLGRSLTLPDHSRSHLNSAMLLVVIFVPASDRVDSDNY